MIADYMRFYGCGFHDVAHTPAKWFFKLYNEIGAVRSYEMSLNASVVSYPHLTSNGRKSFDSRVKNQSKSAVREVLNVDEAWQKARKVLTGA